MGMSTADSRSLRAACLDAVRRLTAVSGDWVVVAPGRREESYGNRSRGSLRGYGVDVSVSLADDESHPSDSPPSENLPLPVLLAGWLRAQAGANRVRVELVAADDDPATCTGHASRLARTAAERGLLVFGDGSNRRGARSPGGHDDRAEGFDNLVARALATGDAPVLRELDSELAVELGSTGRVTWQVLASLPTDTGQWSGELLYSGAPF